MASFELEQLRRRVAEAARRSFGRMCETHPGEPPYAFALYTVDDAVAISPSGNSERGYDLARGEYGADGSFSEAGLLGNFRWSCFDWTYECEGSDYFDPVHELINDRGQARYDQDDPDGFMDFKANVLAAMVLALSDLKAEGVFDSGEGRSPITVFASITDPDYAPWLEADSARRLNSPELFEAFLAERVAYIAGDPSPPAPVGDELYDRYLALVQGHGEAA